MNRATTTVALRRHPVLGLLVALSIGLTHVAAGGDEIHDFAGRTMGTTYAIHAVGALTPDDCRRLHAEIDALLEQVNHQMSTWRDDSEISRFNRHTGDDWYAVSAETAQVVSVALEMAAATCGAFDVTVGPLVNLWQFGPDRQPAHLPTEAELQAARQNVGYQHLEARLDPPALRKTIPGLYVDLSGIAKGFGVDEVARLLDRWPITGYLVEIGGEVRCRGHKPDGSGWRVGVEAPSYAGRSLQRVVELADRSLATSGDYRSYRELNGRRVTHIIDPRTARPIEHGLASVTVVADNCMRADALATALTVLGPDDAYNWAAEHDLAALLVSRETDRFVERATPRFAQLVPSTAADAGGSPMETFLFALVAFGIAVAAMAVGVLFGRRRLRGTCGGLANLRDSKNRPMCEACSDPSPECAGLDEGRRRSTANH